MSVFRLRSAIAVSAVLHGLLGMWVEVRGGARPAVEREVADAWAGRGIEVDAIPLATAPATDASPEPPHTATAVAPQKAPANPAEAHAEPPMITAAAEPVKRERSPRTTPVKPMRRANPTNDATATNGASPTNRADDANPPNGVNDANPPSSASSETFGAAGLPPGVRHLPKAFTRALSIADRGDPRWLTLPPGLAGEARVELPVGDDGKLGELSYPDETERDKLAPVVRHLLENTRLLLESGHFSLDPSNLRAGVERLRVRVEVVERLAASDPEGDPNELKELEYEPPARGKPGRGSFALNSGRRVIGWVYLE